MEITKYNNIEINYSDIHLKEVNLLLEYHDTVEDRINNLWELDKPKKVKIYFINSYFEYIRYSFRHYSFLGKIFLIVYF